MNRKALGENKRQRRAKGRREGKGEKEDEMKSGKSTSHTVMTDHTHIIHKQHTPCPWKQTGMCVYTDVRQLLSHVSTHVL